MPSSPAAAERPPRVRRKQPLHPGKATAWILGLALGSSLFVWATKAADIGVALFDYNVSFLVTTIAYVALWRPLSRDRTAIGIPLLVTAVLAIVTGFFLLYAKDWLKTEGWKDVAKYWHSLTSWLLLLVTVGHVVVNWVSVRVFFARLFSHAAPALVFLGSWAIVVAAVWYTVRPEPRTWFTDAEYLFLSSLAILACVAVAYALWMLWMWRTGAWSKELIAAGAVPHHTTAGEWDRYAVRRHLDTHLLFWYVFAQGSGLVLLYFKDFLHGNGLKYVSKFWHTAPSAVLTVMLFAHAVFTWPLMRAYWHRWRRALLAR